MDGQQIVPMHYGAIVPMNRDQEQQQQQQQQEYQQLQLQLHRMTEWQQQLETSLFERLFKMTEDPAFLLEIEQKTEACFNELMIEGVDKLQAHADTLSSAAELELATFKKKAGDHLEERIQLATASAHAEAESHAKRLQAETENQMNTHLRRLIAEAKTEAADFAVVEVKTSVKSAERQIAFRADSAVRDMIKRFDDDASDRMRKLLEDAYKRGRKTIQAFGDDQVVEIRRRVGEDVERAFRDTRSKEETSAIAAIRKRAAEETRALVTAIESKIDTAFEEVRSRQSAALAKLDERADVHSSAVVSAIQHQVKTAWTTSESVIRSSIVQDITAQLQKHRNDVSAYVDSRIASIPQVDDKIQSIIRRESHDIDKRCTALEDEMRTAMRKLDDRIGDIVKSAHAKPSCESKSTTCDVDARLEEIKQDVRNAVLDLDEKIAEVSRSIATSIASNKPVGAMQDERLRLVKKELELMAEALEAKVKEEVQRALPSSNLPSNVELMPLIRQEVGDAFGKLDATLQERIDKSKSSCAQDVASILLRKQDVELASVRSQVESALEDIHEKVKAEVRQSMNAFRARDHRPSQEARVSNSATRVSVKEETGTASDRGSQTLGEPGRPSSQIVQARRAGISTSRGVPREATRLPVVASTQTASKFDEEAREIEAELLRAWEAAGDSDTLSLPDQLRSIHPQQINAFLTQYQSYKKQGGQQSWTVFVRPGLVEYIRGCELDGPTSDAAVFEFLKSRAKDLGKDNADMFDKLFERVSIEDDNLTPHEQVESILLGMEEAIATHKQANKHVDVPIAVYARIALSKLPATLQAHTGDLRAVRNKNQVKRALLDAAQAQQN